MDENRRAGNDRRHDPARHVTDRRFGSDRRGARERRELMKDPDVTVGRLRRIPLFSDLNMQQYTKILSICTKRELVSGEVLCTAGDAADSLFVLVSGTLHIAFRDGREMSRLAPREIIGKLGFFTGEKHTATVTADSDSTVLTITRDEIMRIFTADKDLWVKVLSNLVAQLTDKLKKNTQMIRDLNTANSLEIL